MISRDLTTILKVDESAPSKELVPKEKSTVKVEQHDYAKREEDGALELRRSKILVVDDEPAIREMTMMILEDYGYNVVTAGNGKEAIDEAQQNVPDLILLDIAMPDMNGIEACRTLKSQPKTRSIPVVIFTVMDDQESRQLAEQASCDGFFVKPFPP
jgi:CheY-like chemotaxis protein